MSFFLRVPLVPDMSVKLTTIAQFRSSKNHKQTNNISLHSTTMTTNAMRRDGCSRRSGTMWAKTPNGNGKTCELINLYIINNKWLFCAAVVFVVSAHCFLFVSHTEDRTKCPCDGFSGRRKTEERHLDTVEESKQKTYIYFAMIKRTTSVWYGGRRVIRCTICLLGVRKALRLQCEHWTHRKSVKNNDDDDVVFVVDDDEQLHSKRTTQSQSKSKTRPNERMSQRK